MIPEGDSGDKSVYCSGCYSPNSSVVPQGFGDAYDDEVEHEELTELLNSALPYGSDACPQCGEPMVVKDEYDISCPNCGFEV